MDGEENTLIVSLKSGKKDWVFDECRGVPYPFLVREFSVDRVLEWTIMRCSFFKSKSLRYISSGMGLRL